MHGIEPSSCQKGIAARQWWPARRARLTCIAGAIVLWATFVAASPAGGRAAGQAAGVDSNGSDACATCHGEVVKSFAGNPHASVTEMHGKSVTCQNCHGPGKAHADNGDPGKIFNPSKAAAKEADAKCMECHNGQHSSFESSGHGEANVSCVHCHSVHADKDHKHLLKASQPALCFDCHADARPQFSMPSHHKVEEGRMVCTDCHDPHGALGRKGLKTAAQQDAVCTKCHKEIAGPFVYEHDAVKTEGCTACHFPHGGSNPRLLNRAAVNTICQQCHSPSLTNPGHQASQNQSCTICHADIHGSNTHPNFFKKDL